VPYYDSLIGKLIVHSSTRAEAVEKMKRALNEFVIDGINTTVDLHKKIISSTPFNDYKYSINWLEDFLKK
jgi:acetyl-CoA carboxylase biotin carboxylase subunit